MRTFVLLLIFVFCLGSYIVLAGPEVHQSFTFDPHSPGALGDTTPGTTLDMTGPITIAYLGDDAQWYLETYSTGVIDYSRLRLRKSDSNTVLAQTDANDYLGIIQFEGCNTTPAFAAGSRIWAMQTNTAGAMIPAEMRLGVADDTNLFSEQLVLSDDFRVGVGIHQGEKPLATFQVQGTVYVPLTGTVTVITNTTGVEGAGTDFVNELFVGSTIRIPSNQGSATFSEIFTVAAITDADTLTLDSNFLGTIALSGLTAWTDGDLFKVSDGEKNVKFTVDNVGRIVIAESSAPTALADHAFLYAKDVGGTGNMFVADAAAGETQISPHNFDLFQPDTNEAYPWSYHSQSHSLGKKINVDMAGAIRAIEALSGKTFIYYEDIPKSVNLEAIYRKQWKQGWIKENITEVEITIQKAMEMVEVNERVLYEVVNHKTGKIVKQGKKLDENIIGYELIDGKIKPKIEIVWETKKVKKPQMKQGVRFNETNGKFYKIVIPTFAQAEIATQLGFIFEAPKWLKNRLVEKIQ